jgi:hypothetical protein
MTKSEQAEQAALAEAVNSKKWLGEALELEKAQGNGHKVDRLRSMGQHASQMGVLWLICAESIRSNELLEAVLEELQGTARAREQP